MTARSLSLTALLLAPLVTAGVIYLELSAVPYLELPQSTERPISKALQELPGEPPSVLPPIAAFTDTLRRPVFAQSRRPAEKKVEPVAQSNDPVAPLKVVVKGIVFTPKSRIAIIWPDDARRRSTPAPVIYLSEGSEFEGWTLQEVRPKSVVFRHNQTEVDLKLDFR
jgi:hypothetical protein